MDRRRSLQARWGRLRRTEQWVRRAVAGGLTLLVGLWVLELAASGTPVWLAGLVLALVGLGVLFFGIRHQLITA